MPNRAWDLHYKTPTDPFLLALRYYRKATTADESEKLRARALERSSANNRKSELRFS